jgi:hypothetical protein
MSSVTQMRRAPPPIATRSPERSALAAAIANRDAATTRLAQLRSAVERLPYVWRSEDAVDAARAAIEEARKTDARAMTDAAIAGTTSPPSAVPAARAALQVAEDALAARVATGETLTADIAELTSGEHGRDGAIDRAIQAVLLAESAPAVASLVASLESLHREMTDKHLALRALARVDAVVMKENGLYTDAGNVSQHFQNGAGILGDRWSARPDRCGLASSDRGAEDQPRGTTAGGVRQATCPTHQPYQARSSSMHS